MNAGEATEIIGEANRKILVCLGTETCQTQGHHPGSCPMWGSHSKELRMCITGTCV